MSGTPYTMRKYRAWIEQRHGTIAALNAAYRNSGGRISANALKRRVANVLASGVLCGAAALLST